VIRAVIFDMDETLVDSSDTWTEAEARLFRYLGREFSPEVAEDYKGMNATDIGRTVHAWAGSDRISGDECGPLLKEWLIANFDGPLETMPGADDLVRRLAGRFDLAIASGSPLEAIHRVADRFDWTPHYKIMVSSEEISRGKPNPDIFLLAAERLGIPACECLVIEDSLHGVRAAKSAGMACFAVPSSPNPDIGLEADRCFSSLLDVQIEMIYEF
jgi:HAD superfamily hydrolase (TIGR01549 family)